MSNEELLVVIKGIVEEVLEEKLEEKLERKFDEKLAPINQKIDEMEQVKFDVDTLKNVVAKHSEILQKIS